MGRFTVIPQNTFSAIQLDAGILLKAFNPANPTIADENIICATTGGINPSCTPTFSDLGEDVDNCPNNMKELKHLDGWECSISTTSLGTSPELIKLALGCADIDGTNTSKIVPRKDLEQTDFADLWWVGDRADGGFVAIKLKNALSTGGFSLQTTKNGKGQTSITLTGHVSINAQSEMPMEFYSVDPDDSVPYVRFVTSVITVEEGDTAELEVVTNPASATVTWSSTDEANATVEDGVVTGVAEGTARVVASITQSDVTYTDECIIIVSAGA